MVGAEHAPELEVSAHVRTLPFLVASETRRSGLWNVNHVDERYGALFVDVLEIHISRLV